MADKKLNYRNRSCLSTFPSPACPKYDHLPLDVRVKIAQYRVPAFSPTGVTPTDDGQYTREWWNSLTGDEQGAAFWSSMFPHRIDPEFSNRRPVMSTTFYTPIEEWNAWSWYESCPEHLRRRIDESLAKQPKAEEVKSSSPLYKKVAQVWGQRPVMRHDEDIEHYHWMEEWVFEYETQQMIETVLRLGPEIQKERRMLNQAMGLDVESNDLPSQAEGLDDTQAATVRWLQASGEMPLEFLARTYRSENAKMSDRITAARTLMDYVHRKVPVKQELETKDITEPKLSPTALKSLSDKDLKTLESLLSKLNKV